MLRSRLGPVLDAAIQFGIAAAKMQLAAQDSGLSNEELIALARATQRQPGLTGIESRADMMEAALLASVAYVTAVQPPRMRRRRRSTDGADESNQLAKPRKLNADTR